MKLEKEIERGKQVLIHNELVLKKYNNNNKLVKFPSFILLIGSRDYVGQATFISRMVHK